MPPFDVQKGAGGLGVAKNRLSASRSQKAAVHGRSALALLRTSPRALCLARWLCLGASRTGQKRRPATQSEGSRPAPVAESRRRAALWRLWPAAMTLRLAGLPSGGCGGFAQSCGQRCSFDRRRSDPCLRHPQGSCGRFARVRVRADGPLCAASPNQLHQSSEGLRYVAPSTARARENKTQKVRAAKIFPSANWPIGESARAKSKRHRVRTPAQPELFAETVTPEGFFL